MSDSSQSPLPVRFGDLPMFLDTFNVAPNEHIDRMIKPFAFLHQHFPDYVILEERVISVYTPTETRSVLHPVYVYDDIVVLAAPLLDHGERFGVSALDLTPMPLIKVLSRFGKLRPSQPFSFSARDSLMIFQDSWADADDYTLGDDEEAILYEPTQAVLAEHHKVKNVTLIGANVLIWRYDATSATATLQPSTIPGESATYQELSAVEEGDDIDISAPEDEELQYSDNFGGGEATRQEWLSTAPPQGEYEVYDDVYDDEDGGTGAEETKTIEPSADPAGMNAEELRAHVERLMEVIALGQLAAVAKVKTDEEKAAEELLNERSISARTHLIYEEYRASKQYDPPPLRRGTDNVQITKVFDNVGLGSFLVNNCDLTQMTNIVKWSELSSLDFSTDALRPNVFTTAQLNHRIDKVKSERSKLSGEDDLAYLIFERTFTDLTMSERTTYYNIKEFVASVEPGTISNAVAVGMAKKLLAL